MPRFDLGLVIGKFAPLHRGHQLVIEAALSECGHVAVWAYSSPDFEEMPNEVRSNWLRTLYPRVTVLPPPLNPPPNDAQGEVHRAFVKAQLARLGIHPDAVYTGEAYGEPLALALGCVHREVDSARLNAPISGSAIRANLHGRREWLAPEVYAHFVEKVVILGAESTGKSTLAAALAGEFGTVFAHEVGRNVFERENGALRPEHFSEIALAHRALEDGLTRSPGAHRYLFSDTNAITTAMWSFLLTRTCEPEVLALAGECKTRYARVFVCDDDLPFEQDGWRSNKAVRGVQQSLMLYDLAARGIPYVLLTGSTASRVRQVREVLEARVKGRGSGGPGTHG